MRFRNPSAAGKASQRVQAKARIESGSVPLRRPDPGTVLHTVLLTNHVARFSQKIEIAQAARKNQVVAICFGRVSKPHGVDWFTKQLRKRLVVRWLEV